MQESPTQPPQVAPFTLDAEGIIRLTLVTLIGGIGPGLFLAVQSRLIYVIFVYPIIMTIGSGLCAAVGVIAFRLRIGSAIVLWAIAIGLLMYGSYRATDYLMSVRTQSAEAGNPASITFIDYVKQKAKSGQPIASVGGNESGLSLSEPLTWLYWGAELVMICGGGSLIATRGLAGAVDG